MPYCAVFGCNSNSKVDKDVSWFRFLKLHSDGSRHKSWTHYCKRKGFTPTQQSKVCSRHFSSSQYDRDPAFMATFGYAGARPSLRPDAVPDIPWVYSPVSTGQHSETEVKSVRGALAKRRKREVLEEAMAQHTEQQHRDDESAAESPDDLSDQHLHQKNHQQSQSDPSATNLLKSTFHFRSQ